MWAEHSVLANYDAYIIDSINGYLEADPSGIGYGVTAQ
jgi:hypothetical protein